MASKAPKHDFAPAWLKIPEQESLKPGGAKSSEHADKSGRQGPRGRDDYYYRYGPGGPSGGPADYYANGPLPRQRSFDNYYDDRRNYSQPGKFRHHSVEEEYYNANAYGYGYYNNGYPYPGGGGGDKYGGSHYRSQPSLYRDGGKYPPPNGRGYQVNGGYPPYYDGYMYDYYQGDTGYYNGYGNGGSNGRGGGSKRLYGERGGSNGDKEGRHGMRNGEREARGQDPEAGKEGSLEEEFPSLNGENESQDGKTGKTPNNGVWDGKPKIGTGRNSSNHMYRILVPNKSGPGKKTVGKGSTDANSNSGNTKSSSTVSDPFIPAFKKDANKEGSPTPPMDILNTRLVTQPKTISDKKSDFLKALRRDNAGTTPDDLNAKDCNMFLEGKESGEESYSNGAKHEEDDENKDHNMDTLSNGVEDLELGSSPNQNILSSSLEAEQRLLREMGWTEADEGECELTEDEKREMEELKRKLKLRKEQCNGVKRVLPKTWSPQHMYPAAPLSHLNPLSSHALAPMACDDDDTDSDLDL